MSHQLQAVEDKHVDGLCALINRTYVADNVPMVISPTELADLLTTPHTNPAEDARVVLIGEVIVGYVVVMFRPTGRRQENTFLMGTVDELHRRVGIGAALIEWGIARSRERFAPIQNELPRIVRVEAYPWQQDRIDLFEQYELLPARFFSDMIRSLEVVPEATTVGFALEKWSSDHDEPARLVYNESFRDHWGSTPADPESWDSWLKAAPTRLDLSYVALVDEQLVGVALNANYPEDQAVTGRSEGWIELLGTLKEHRGRGIATALIVASCSGFAEAGFTHAALGVDNESQTGANKLYANLGFVVDRQSILLQRQL
jgi:ribosomal protein S18 acetylase RimI-like enzyme